MATATLATADSFTANFDVQNPAFPFPSGATSLGSITFTLNADGTITGNVASFLPITVVAFNSQSGTPQISNLPTGYSNVGFLGTLFGAFNGGAYNVQSYNCNCASPTQLNTFQFTVSQPGGFTSAFQLANLNGPDAFFLLSESGQGIFEAGGIAPPNPTTVPEPSSLLLLGSGLLGVMGMALHRKRP